LRLREWGQNKGREVLMEKGLPSMRVFGCLAGSSLDNASNHFITGNWLNFYWQYITPIIGKRCQSSRIIRF